MEEENSEYLTHPVLGRIGWLPGDSHWSGKHVLPTGDTVDLMITPEETDKYAFLARAADLFQWGLANERSILSQAAISDLYDLYDIWAEEEMAFLDANGLMAVLKWDLFVISVSDTFPVEFVYSCNDLFPGHGVCVRLNTELQYDSTSLQG